MPLIIAPGDYQHWLSDEPDLNAAVPCRPNADVADLNAGQQARDRSSYLLRDRTSSLRQAR
jgi:hypothetical protein